MKVIPIYVKVPDDFDSMEGADEITRAAQEYVDNNIKDES